MEILVTGGNGFIGRFLVRKLINEGYKVKIIDKNIDKKLKKEMPEVEFYKLDISNTNINWKDILKNVNIVYHLAGLLGTSELFERAIEAERINVLGTLNLLEAMRKHKVEKILFTTKPNIWKHNIYTITKENCERYLDMYYNIYGIKPIIACPYNVYGPEEKIEEYRKAVPYFIISALKNNPIEIFGNGEQTMDLIYVEDCVNAMIESTKNKDLINKTIELGTGKDIKVNELAKKIIKLTKSNSKIIHREMRKGEIPNSRVCANINNMKKILGCTPKISLIEGLGKTIQHYRQRLNEYKIYNLD